jgi:molybdopterin biosynthesis enzyme
VRLGDNGEELSAFPLQSKSAIISTVASADGYVILEQGSEGKRAGEPVLVYLWGEEHG